MTRLTLCCVTAFASCGADGDSGIERLMPAGFMPTTVTATLPLSGGAVAADERGGGLFIDTARRVVRLRADVSQAPLESHPQNRVSPGAARGVWPFGPSAALVDTEKGPFVADQGWLIAPPWRDRLAGGEIRDVVVTESGAAWVAHSTGVYRIEGGGLEAFTVDGQPLTAIRALALGPAPDGSPGVWLADAQRLLIAAQQSRSAFIVTEVALQPEEMKSGVLGLAGIGASCSTGGEVWAITTSTLLRFSGSTVRRFSMGAPLKQLKSAGRSAWLTTAQGVYVFDGTVWRQATGVEPGASLLGVEASGQAWVRDASATRALAVSLVPRVWGLFEGLRQYEPDAVIRAALPAGSTPTSLQYRFDDQMPVALALDAGVPGEGALQNTTFFSLGGYEADGKNRALSLASLNDGPHCLMVEATIEGDVRKRIVPFVLSAASSRVGYAADLKGLSDTRCATCHQTGTLPELRTFEQWKANADAIATAVRERRMPADGPLDAASIQAVQRWVAGGKSP
jgi:mono/diheme cytochrome c family protein